MEMLTHSAPCIASQACKKTKNCNSSTKKNNKKLIRTNMPRSCWMHPNASKRMTCCLRSSLNREQHVLKLIFRAQTFLKISIITCLCDEFLLCRQLVARLSIKRSRCSGKAIGRKRQLNCVFRSRRIMWKANSLIGSINKSSFLMQMQLGLHKAGELSVDNRL